MFAVAVVIVIALAWLIGVLGATDFAAQRADRLSFFRVLAVFAHPDDEASTCGGTLNLLARSGCEVTLLLLTRGERGNRDGKRDPELARIRNIEASAASDLLGIRLIHEDLGDGSLRDSVGDVMRSIAAALERERPDLIITHDPSGLYGHPDHVACSQIVARLRTDRRPSARLWYATVPARLRRFLVRTAQIPSDPALHLLYVSPNRRVFIGPSLVVKIRAWRAHKSQHRSFGRGVARLLPSWLFLSVLLFEHFAEVA